MRRGRAEWMGAPGVFDSMGCHVRNTGLSPGKKGMGRIWEGYGKGNGITITNPRNGSGTVYEVTARNRV